MLDKFVVVFIFCVIVGPWKETVRCY